MRLSRQEAWCYLSQVAEPPNLQLVELLAEGTDPVELALRIRDRRALPKELLGATAARAASANPGVSFAAAEAAGARLLTVDSPEWPTQLLGEAFTGIETTRDNALPPIALWAIGNGNLAQLLARSITIVGTRAASRYGLNCARELAAELAASGYTIVSGGALGIDTAAHEGALSAGGHSLAVAAHGPGVVYPKANEQLFHQLTGRGLIVSEYAPGQRPHRHRFLTRNRLAAAFGQVAVLVEAGYRSGALSTVSWAEAMNRPVAAVPGPVTSRMSVACHERIRENRAVLVGSADQVRELVETVGSVPDAEQLAIDLGEVNESISAELSRSELRVFDAMIPGRANSSEDVAAEAGVTLGLAVHILVSLERMGLVLREGSMWRRIR